jgi:hypothetical protein
VVIPLYRALKRAPTGAGIRYPRLKPGATVLTQASPAVRAGSNDAIHEPPFQTIEMRQCGASRSPTVLTQASPAVRTGSNDAIHEPPVSTVETRHCGASRSTKVLTQASPAVRAGSNDAIHEPPFQTIEMRQCGASRSPTVLTQALPAVRASSKCTLKGRYCCAATCRGIPCSASFSGGEAAVRTVAPGFNRRFSDARTDREPALAGERTVPA